jgi:hypothetical protein
MKYNAVYFTIMSMILNVAFSMQRGANARRRYN